mmetsp:Transcript_3127/g.11123  ORF Transcript_3127/g.11123 Transcript_3127/m.11123 type:complete len:248 (+) Transcript_3127:639-1382(+)
MSADPHASMRSTRQERRRMRHARWNACPRHARRTPPRARRVPFGFVFPYASHVSTSRASDRTRSVDPFHSTSPSYIRGTRTYVPCLSAAMAKMPSTSTNGSGTSRRQRSASSPAWTSGSTPDTSTPSIFWNHSTTRAICGCHARTSSSDTRMRAMSASCTTSGPSRGWAHPRRPRARFTSPARRSTPWCDHGILHDARVHNAIARVRREWDQHNTRKHTHVFIFPPIRHWRRRRGRSCGEECWWDAK